MVTNISLTQWKWSIGFNPLQNHKLLTPHNKLMWLRNIRNFMMELGIQITKPNHEFPLLQENDEYLMQKAVQLTIDAREMRHISYCRLYLNVITLSDKTEPDGKHVCSDIYHYIKLLHGDSNVIKDAINISQRNVTGMHGTNHSKV
jgi:hypothetical protein